MRKKYINKYRSIDKMTQQEVSKFCLRPQPVSLSPPGVVSMAGRVYAVGGFNSSLRERTVDVYDGARDQWSTAASMQERRSTLGAAVLGELLYAVGGFNGSIGKPDGSSGT